MRVFVLLALLILPFTGQAQKMIERDGYEVHYNAFPSLFLSAKTAAAYKLVRSGSRGVLMVHLRKGDDSVGAIVQVKASNQLGQPRAVPIQQIYERGEHPAIYYIGQFGHADEETLTFSVLAQPEGGQPIRFQFTQQFFED